MLTIRAKSPESVWY